MALAKAEAAAQSGVTALSGNEPIDAKSEDIGESIVNESHEENK